MSNPTRVALYCALMEEIKHRIKFVDNILLNPPEAPGVFLEESCLLQFRMIFELVAIACLAVQGNHLNIRRLEKEWSANEIMPHLEKLNPEFFPKAVRIERMPDQNFEMEDIQPVPIDKTTFLTAYGRFGNRLHRGNLRKIVSGKTLKTGKIGDLIDMSRCIKELLNKHRTPSPDLKTNYICTMQNPPDGRVVVVTTQSL